MGNALTAKQIKAISKHLKNLSKEFRNGPLDLRNFEQDWKIEPVPNYSLGLMEGRHTGMVTLTITYFDPRIVEREKEQAENERVIQERMKAISEKINPQVTPEWLSEREREIQIMGDWSQYDCGRD